MTRVHDVEIRPLPARPDLAEDVLSTCGFCSRKEWIKPAEFQRNAGLAHGRYHCTFCLRHGHHHRDARNVLPLNFLGLIGYYYHNLYQATPRTMWLSQIANYVEKHEKAGLACPVFSYDRSTGMWFVDFNRVGRGKNESPIEEVQEVVRQLIDGFEISKNIPGVNEPLLIQKYGEAIDLFYSQRQRPREKKVLSPTLRKCVTNDDDFEATKKFKLSFILDSSPANELPTIMEADTDLINNLADWAPNAIQVVVKEKKVDGIAGFEGIVSIPGLKPSKIARKDGSTFFTTRNGLNSVARGFAKRLSRTVTFVEPPKKARKAAKGTESRKNAQG